MGPGRVQALGRLAARLRGMAEDGLNPADYPVPPDAQLASDPAGYVELLGRSATQALGDLLHGKLRSPLPGRPDLARDTAALPLQPWLAELAASPDPTQVLDRAALLPPDAAPLKAALAVARARVAAGAWPSVPGGPNDTIEPGSWDAAKVPALRARLAATDPSLPRIGNAFYDPALVAAAKRFQEAAGLEADGRIGRLNITASAYAALGEDIGLKQREHLRLTLLRGC